MTLEARQAERLEPDAAREAARDLERNSHASGDCPMRSRCGLKGFLAPGV